jgi:hypothetical protein
MLLAIHRHHLKLDVPQPPGFQHLVGHVEILRPGDPLPGLDPSNPARPTRP